MKLHQLSFVICVFALCLLCLNACNSAPESETTELPQPIAQTLGSLTKVDAYPLYVMHWTGPYGTSTAPSSDEQTSNQPLESASSWACSLFASLGNPDQILFGRNFDWEYSPMLLLHTNPDDGYACITSVDFSYFFEDESVLSSLEERPIQELTPLLEAPFLPFNGLNEHGLAVAMAAVAPDTYPLAPNTHTVGHMQFMRVLLEEARTTEEAIALAETVSLNNQGGPHLHYLLADRKGEAAVLEYVDEQLVVHRNEDSWHMATNFTLTQFESWDNVCPRYDRLSEALATSGGALETHDAMDLLQAVSVTSTQWSIVYDLTNLTISIALAGNYESIHTFSFTPEKLHMQ